MPHPKWCIVQHKYDEIVAKLQPKYIEKVRNGMADEQELIQLGEEAWA